MAMLCRILAYVNPGEGTLIWQFLIGLGGGLLFFGKTIFLSLKARIPQVFVRKVKRDEL